MLIKGYSLPKIYWIILIPLVLVISSINLIKEIQKYSFNDLEDLGRYILLLYLVFLNPFFICC